MTNDEMIDRARAKTLTKDEAIAFVNERLAVMFEAINGVAPTLSAEVEPHILMVGWVPTLIDYGRFVKRANDAAIATQDLKARFEEEMSEARGLQFKAQDEANRATRTLKNAEQALRKALCLIEDSRGEK